MDRLFAQLKLVDVHEDLCRNVVSIRASQDLFDDLSDKPEEWALAQQVEDEVKPPPYQSMTPVIHRPFEDAQWFSAIGWPFTHWRTSRFSDGTFGVWYGSDSIETTVYETAYHWLNGLLRDAGFDSLNAAEIVGERRVYDVRCDAALIDLRTHARRHPGLMHKSDYSATQAIGARMHKEGHPGLVTRSVRRPTGQTHAVLNPAVLSAPRHRCHLTYRLQGRSIIIEKRAGHVWHEISTARL